MPHPETRLSPKAAEKLLVLSNDALVVVDTSGNIVFANRQAELLFGYEPGGLIGEAVESLVPDSVRTQHQRQRTQHRANPHARPLVSGLKLQGRRKDGSTFDAEIALTPVADDGRKLVASTIREIGSGNTSDAHFRNLLESAPDAMVIVDQEGVISVVNEQSEEIFGYPREQLIGRPVEMLLPQGIRERHVSHREDYVKDARVRPMGASMELKARRADGTEFAVEISLSPVSTANGSFIYSVIRDVTRRKRFEGDLIESRQSAELAHKANTAFLAAASHDLRQPVQALALLNGALRRTVSDPLALEMVESQQHSLDAMTNLLNSLLDISRLDGGAVTPEFESFPVQRLIDRFAADCERQARQKGLEWQAFGDASTIHSDPKLLCEIVQNLVSNAIRYTENGQVTLSCRAVDKHLSIEVRDTGIGIGPENLNEIFREFHQLRHPSTENEGFGLGLAIVRRLADLLDHEIFVSSTLGEGSCFSVRVPLVEGQPASSPTPTAKRAERQFEKPSEGGLILIIEDDPRVAGAWRLLLKVDGYRVLMAESADEAVAVVEQLTDWPDLIISDFHLLEGSNGIEAVTRIRKLSNTELPAFIVSGDTSKVVDQAKTLSNSVLLSKPVNTAELLEMAHATIASGHVPED